MFGLLIWMIVLVVLVFGVAAGLRFMGVGAPGQPAPGALTREDLHRLEEALGGLEARLDRLEDQQRFVERLLERRPEPGALPPPGSSRPEPATGAERGEGAGGEGQRGVDSVLFDVERGED